MFPSPFRRRLAEQRPLKLAELVQFTGASRSFFLEMIAAGALKPAGRIGSGKTSPITVSVTEAERVGRDLGALED